MVEVDTALKAKLESIVEILVKRIATEEDALRIEALCKCLQGFVGELREMEAIPAQSVYREVAERVSGAEDRLKALEAWSELVKAHLSRGTYVRPAGGIGAN